MEHGLIPGGVATYSDVVAVLGRRRLRAALDSGVLTQPWRGVIIHAEAALDLRTRARAALLKVGPHGVISGSTAVALHGCSAAITTDVHVTVPYAHSPRSHEGLVVHRNRFSPSDVVQVAGLPTFALDLALADFLCDGDRWAAFASLDQALRGCDAEAIASLKKRIHRRLEVRDDPRGVNKATMLTELSTGKADSPPESFIRLIVVEAGFPIPEAQYAICTIDGELLYLLDMAWESRRIALEYDGYAAHEGRKAYDAERDRRLTARGWIVIRVRADDLKDPTRLLCELRTAFARRP